MLAKLWKSVNGLWFFGFLMGLIERIKKTARSHFG